MPDRLRFLGSSIRAALLWSATAGQGCAPRHVAMRHGFAGALAFGYTLQHASALGAWSLQSNANKWRNYQCVAPAA
eukprot:9502346-Pyramimonas_sp.AAC.3